MDVAKKRLGSHYRATSSSTNIEKIADTGVAFVVVVVGLLVVVPMVLLAIGGVAGGAG